jgi:hypothetical protein
MSISERKGTFWLAVWVNLREHTGPKMIYGEDCLLSAQHRKGEGIVFKQVLYEIKVS